MSAGLGLLFLGCSLMMVRLAAEWVAISRDRQRCNGRGDGARCWHVVSVCRMYAPAA